MKKLTLLALPLLLSSLLPAAPKVEPAGFQVVWKSFEDRFEYGGVMNSNSPLTLAIVISDEKKDVIGYDEKGSKKPLVKDAEGKDLGGKLGSFPKNSEDGKLLLLEIQSEKTPSPGSTKFSVTGELTLLLASESQKHQSALTKWEKGVVKDLPKEFPLKILTAEKPKYGDDAWEVNFELSSPPDAIKTIRFFTPAGKEIESQTNGSSSGGMFGKMTYTRSYSLKKAAPEVKIEIETYTDLEKVKISLDLQFGAK